MHRCHSVPVCLSYAPAQYLVLALVFSSQSLATAALPHCPSLLAMRLVETCYGLGVGSFHTVGNQLLVRNLLPGMIHALTCFCFAILCPAQGLLRQYEMCQDLDRLRP